MPFELQPTLVGQLLILRPLRPEDFDSLFAVASDPLIWEQHPARDRYKEDVFRAFFADALASGGAFLVLDAKDNRVLGSTRYYSYDEAAGGSIELGYTFLARSCWGGTYNREMKRLLLEHAFQYVDSVNFLVGAGNIRSQKAMEKIGGVKFTSRFDAAGNESYVYRMTPFALSAISR